MTGATEPEQVRRAVDRMEAEIVDVSRAAGDDDHDGGAEDTTATVPGAPEPPD